jgi:2-dehydropantoate 2-reductase
VTFAFIWNKGIHMRVAVIGTGALGCLFAARLAPHAEVWMLGTWAAAVDAVQQHGVCVHEGNTVWQARVRAAADPAAVPHADAALVLVKSFQTARAAAWAARCLTRGGLALTLQNGLDNAARLAAAVGEDRCAVGATFEGATVLAPGEIHHAGRGPTYLGMWQAGSNHSGRAEERLEAVAALLHAAGFAAELRSDMAAVLWGKAVVNAAINPLTALWRVPNGELLANDERQRLLAALAEEAAAVAAAALGERGETLPYGDAAARVEAVCRATAANHSSMLQDVTHGRPTEIDSINGVIVAEGRRLGLPTPLNAAVWQLVRGLFIENKPITG